MVNRGLVLANCSGRKQLPEEVVRQVHWFALNPQSHGWSDMVVESGFHKGGFPNILLSCIANRQWRKNGKTGFPRAVSWVDCVAVCYGWLEGIGKKKKIHRFLSAATKTKWVGGGGGWEPEWNCKRIIFLSPSILGNWMSPKRIR